MVKKVKTSGLLFLHLCCWLANPYLVCGDFLSQSCPHTEGGSTTDTQLFSYTAPSSDVSVITDSDISTDERSWADRDEGSDSTVVPDGGLDVEEEPDSDLDSSSDDTSWAQNRSDSYFYIPSYRTRFMNDR